jgi:hypothetical protein
MCSRPSGEHATRSSTRRGTPLRPSAPHAPPRVYAWRTHGHARVSMPGSSGSTSRASSIGGTRREFSHSFSSAASAPAPPLAAAAAAAGSLGAAVVSLPPLPAAARRAPRRASTHAAAARAAAPPAALLAAAAASAAAAVGCSERSARVAAASYSPST